MYQVLSKSRVAIIIRQFEKAGSKRLITTSARDQHVTHIDFGLIAAGAITAGLLGIWLSNRRQDEYSSSEAVENDVSKDCLFAGLADGYVMSSCIARDRK
mmetsp:Transcript_12187/g.18703  ORF Transcript_12187/g.18703 Transcript_12187/m.18703 type:complete len:100 (+) Transcript_12187:76-375(+)